MSTRAHSIAELAQFAQDPTPANQKSVKDWLRVADALRKQGNAAHTDSNLEAAFLFYARSGTM
jgi:alpha-beta hydrolase superfamily lysophospholipase